MYSKNKQDALESLARKLRELRMGRPIGGRNIPWRDSEYQREWVRVARYILKHYERRSTKRDKARAG